MFEHKQAHRTTWVSKNFTDKIVRNQIDYVICQESERKHVLDARSYSGIFLDTDHYLVISKVKINQMSENTRRRYTQRKLNYENFKSAELNDKYKLELDSELKQIDLSSESDDISKSVCKSIKNVSKIYLV